MHHFEVGTLPLARMVMGDVFKKRLKPELDVSLL